jgi:hypothetical protein
VKAREHVTMNLLSRSKVHQSQSGIVGEHRTGDQYLVLLLLVMATLFSCRDFQKGFDAVRTEEENLKTALHRALATNVRPLEAEELAARQKRVDAGLRDLSLAPSENALMIRLNDWHNDPTLIRVALKTLETDDRFIFPYTIFFLALTLFAFALAFLWQSPIPRLSWRTFGLWFCLLLVLFAIFLLKNADENENDYLKALLANPRTGNLAALRFHAQSKFTLLGGAGLSVLLALGIGVRREIRFWTRKTPAIISRRRKFAELLAVEQRAILQARQDKNRASTSITVEAAEEPRASQSSVNFVGLALSGGGIRSATFNLGVLQGLHRYDLLRHVDYLATVSGGGYIGGFWSRWLKETAGQRNEKGLFPDRLKEALKNFSGDSRTFETHEIRHIREFSNFLFPRVGVFDTETWGGAVALLAAILPAVAIALSVLGLSLIAWLALTFYMACPSPGFFDWKSARFNFLVGITLGNFCVMEFWWRSAPTGERIMAGDDPRKRRAIIAVGLALLVWLVATFDVLETYPSGGWVLKIAALLALGVAVFFLWQSIPAREEGHVARYGRIAELSIAVRSGFALGSVGFLAWLWEAIPGLGASKVWIYSPSFDVWFWRSLNANYDDWWKLLGIVPVSPVASEGWIWIPRLYEPTLILLAVAAAFMLMRFKGLFTASSTGHRVLLPTNDRVAMRLLGFATLWALFATFWHIGLNLKGAAYLMGSGAAGTASLFGLLRNWIGKDMRRQRKSGVWETVKPYIPQVLAYLAIGLAWAALATALISINTSDWYSWYISGLIMAAPLFLVLLVDPHEFGLHAVYRDRICRAYLGAAQPGAAHDAKAQENRQTDFRRGDDVYLNSLEPRPLQLICCAANNVGGDHLATLSRGARSGVLSRYGFAMAEAWVEQPGLTLGSAVTTSAAAANSNMGSVSMRVGPAVSFLMTALNLRLGLWVRLPMSNEADLPGYILPGWRFFKEMAACTNTTRHEIHLSDGGHFDNLGLYELVRRHCRYVILSDATADPQVAFDDFGNTIRRIREDFGVEIEIDIEALKPRQDGRAQQHAVVGNIDYGPFDKGVLIYLKPSITGDEPPDISQYKSRNSVFPHESTGDQFYDEAQWESYRRLGVHTINEVFDFVEHVPADEGERVQKVFNEARHVWYPTPVGLAERSLKMTARFAQLEQQFKTDAAIPMLREVFPEIKYTAAPLFRVVPSISPDQELANVGCLMNVMTLMEDAIASCDLQTHWLHPMNRGWINLFARWATAPTFQRWWPLLKPLYGSALREFLEDRFEILRDAPVIGRARVRSVEPTAQSVGFALEWWQTRHGFPPSFAGTTVFQYSVQFLSTPSTTPFTLEIAMVAVTRWGTAASWTSDDLFVPFSLWGSALALDFLNQLLRKLAACGTSFCRVKVKGPSDMDNNQAKWDERQSFVNYYRQAGFRLESYESYEERTSSGAARTGLWAVLTINLD